MLWMRIGTGRTKRYVFINKLAEAITPELCRVLVALHSLTGGDYTSKFGTKYGALLCNPVQYLSDFATKMDLQSIEESIVLCEQFLVQVIEKGSHCRTMDELRLWTYYWNDKKTLDNLPPTSRSTRQHILR